MDGGWNAPADDPDDQPQVVGPTPLAPTTSWSPSAAELLPARSHPREPASLHTLTYTTGLNRLSATLIVAVGD